jgi:hypothetical protein
MVWTVDVNSTKALIFRIIHRDNVPWVLEHGVHCRSSNRSDPNYVQIGDPDLINKRQHRQVPSPPAGTLSDYVPFYFTPFSPMFYNINTGWRGIRQRSNEEIVILVSSLHTLSEKQVPFLFTDRHAYLAAAKFSSDLELLQESIDWAILQRRDFARSADDPGKVERYEAEALVHKCLPVNALLDIFCYTDSVVSDLEQHLPNNSVAPRISKQRVWYF